VRKQINLHTAKALIVWVWRTQAGLSLFTHAALNKQQKGADPIWSNRDNHEIAPEHLIFVVYIHEVYETLEILPLSWNGMQYNNIWIEKRNWKLKNGVT
jgi:hypothetical protein